MKSPAGYRWSWIVHGVAIFAAVLTLPLLYVGGSVTTYHVGLAVPDWPTTFDENMFVYNFWEDAFGVRLEHAHRLYGAAVGLATIVLAGCFLAFERRRWMKALGVFALAAVIIQGVLGGIRVTQRSTLLAAVHGATGQAFFGLMVALAVLTGREWNRSSERTVDPDHLRRRSAVLLALVYVQIILGGWLRHYGTAASLWVHAILAVAVWIHAAILTYRIERRRAEIAPLIVPSRVIGLTSTVQILLGLTALVFVLPIGEIPRPVTSYQAVIRTAHQTNAAIVFAAAIVLSLRSYRHLAGTARVVAGPSEERPVGRPEAAALDWEAVA
jgi:cytochrome c oxidase assembly protein subunit 15